MTSASMRLVSVAAIFAVIGLRSDTFVFLRHFENFQPRRSPGMPPEARRTITDSRLHPAVLRGHRVLQNRSTDSGSYPAPVNHRLPFPARPRTAPLLPPTHC